mmetsp:Transcript_64809/g.204632  ORF Transcript_64809/g.204632 Transcript_64809/m.204632 type:complete len:200 (-) Transcript_64809:808-1407(-)
MYTFMEVGVLFLLRFDMRPPKRFLLFPSGHHALTPPFCTTTHTPLRVRVPPPSVKHQTGGVCTCLEPELALAQRALDRAAWELRCPGLHGRCHSALDDRILAGGAVCLHSIELVVCVDDHKAFVVEDGRHYIEVTRSLGNLALCPSRNIGAAPRGRGGNAGPRLLGLRGARGGLRLAVSLHGGLLALGATVPKAPRADQ